LELANVSYLNCPACQLSIRTQDASPESCPRCRRRDGTDVAMFPSPLPYRLLAGPLFKPPPTMENA
jgi:hypothetical protein